MNSYRSHKHNLAVMLSMAEKGMLISRRQAARIFDCTEGSISIWLNELREEGHEIKYSRSLQKYILHKKEK